MQDDWRLDFDTTMTDDQWQSTGTGSSGNGRERFHLLLFICALAGGALAALIGRILYTAMYNPSGSNVLMVGLILAVIAASVLLACSLCELFRPRITMNHELSFPRILSGLFVAAAVFAAGCLCEFIYEWNSEFLPVVFSDLIFAIDDSGSMRDTDPHELRYSSLEGLLDTLGEDQRAGLVRFNESAYAPVGMAALDEPQRALLREELANASSDGGTNIYEALEVSLDMYRNSAQLNRAAVVVLLSDGYNSAGYNRGFGKTVKAFLKEGVAISTVSLGPNADEALLENLAQSTGGQYFKVEEAGDLAEAFQQVSTAVTYRCLFSPRPGIQRGSVLYMILRVLFLALPGVFIGFFILLLLRSRFANRQLLVSGAAGLLAGIVMEAGTFFFLPLLPTQVVSWILYSIVLLHYCDSVSGIRQGEFEMDTSDSGDMGWDDLPISVDPQDISRIKGKNGRSGRIDRRDNRRPR